MKTTLEEGKVAGKELSKREMIVEMASRARLLGKLLSVMDVRYTTAGHPQTITDDYIYFDDGFEIGLTGKLGGKPEESEKLAKGGKMIFLSAIISVDMIEHP